MDMYNSRVWIIVILFGLFCVVNVNSQNAFLNEPQTVTVDQGATHSLECSVNKTYLIGYFFVAWIREAEVIAARNVIEKDGLSEFIGDNPAELNRYAIVKIEQGNEAMYNLRIENTKGVDTGNYQCVICEHPATSYQCTEITEFQSAVAIYTVKYTPSMPEYPGCTGLDSSATVSVGTQVEVTCTSEIGNPKVDLKWNVDGVEVDSVTERENNNRLYLVYTFTAALEHTGIVLECSSSSSYFPLYSESCSFEALTVVDMPVITVTSGASEYEEGSQANFTCKVSSATTITSFVWTVGNIPSSRYTQDDLGMESVVTITSVESGDHRSLIRCVVTNIAGQTASDQLYMEVIGGPTGIIPTIRIDPPTTKAMITTQMTVTTTPEPGDTGGSIGAAIGGAVAGFVIILLLILTFLYCYKKRKYQEEKNPPGKVMSIGAPQNGMSNHVHIPPVKKLDDDDDVKKEPLPITDEPDVVPRQHNGNHDPRSWWRESMPGDAYAKDENEYPTIKRMQMPFTQRQPSVENLQEHVEMDNYRSSSNDYDDRHSEGYRDVQNRSPADGRYDYNPSPSVHGDNIHPHPQANNYHDYHNPQFDHPDNYHRPPSVDQYSEYSYHQEDPRIQHARSPVNYGPPPQERYDNYRDYGSYDRRNPANYSGHRPGLDNPSYNGDMSHENDMYGRNPNYPDNHDPQQGYSEDGSVFSSATDRYYEQDPRVEAGRSPAFYPDNNGYVLSDRTISPYADIPQGQTNNSSDVLYLQGHDIDTSDPSYV